MFVERKAGKVWKRVSDDKGIRHPYYSDDQTEQTKKFFDKKTWDTGRNYWLFGLLAGVRSQVFSPFIGPRGLPDDLSAGVKAEWKKWEGDGHTASYLTLPELISFQDTVEDVPYHLNVSEFKKFTLTGKIPQSASHFPPYGGVEIISNEKMTRIMNLASFLDEAQYYTKVIEKTPVKDISKAFFVDIIEAMKNLSKDYSKVRCVFWFDN